MKKRTVEVPPRSARVAAAARALVGVPFRLHGRDPATGLDCIGVAALAVRGGGSDAPVPVPTGYALRSGDVGRMLKGLAAAGLEPVGDNVPGTVALVLPGPRQLHLAVLTDAGFVHADGRAKRVVERPGALPWLVLGRWRLREGEE
ncbi:peptidoglycan endopeptidase [Sphingomonas japonica]|uniref:NlpC/P60 family protein n=2 Tax=Sphingomonas japonica TaxID=511662 RepID=A0ABX0TZJ3_9SPHN|nr:peptidoglycan endopeptidase [Sphingomonas japonica]NIJ23738.1 hypothetical protein [Sphingomonas japonica]